MLSPRVFLNLDGGYKADKEQGWIWSWGTDPRGIDTLGVVIIVPAGHDTDNTSTSEKADFLPVILTPDTAGRLNYRVFAIWGGGIDGIETEAAFAEHLQRTTTAFEHAATYQVLTERRRKVGVK